MGSAFHRLLHALASVSIFICCILVPSAHARYLAQGSGLCADGESEWMWAVIEDDCTGQIAQIYIDCEDNHHIGRVCRPNGADLSRLDLALPLSLPPNFVSVLPLADWTTPGGDQGLSVVDAAGQQMRFRNPINQFQADSLQAIVTAAQNCGKGFIGQRVDPSSSMRERFFAHVNSGYQRTLSSGERWKAELADAYVKGKYGSGPPAINCGTDMSVDSRAIEGLLRNRSTVVMKQAPSPGNSQQLLIEPYVPFLAGPVSVVDEQGWAVWRGDVTGETRVDMNGQPSGLYFLRASTGLSLPFNVVR